MTSNPNSVLFNAEDIRNIVIRTRMLGLGRERVLAALTGRLNEDRPTTLAVRGIFDEEWPSEDA
jgi:hypothetical protein